MNDRIDHEGRAAFVSSLPRKFTELRATLGTLVADPRSTRMRDELRRRFNALHTLTRSYSLPQLSDGLREGIAHLDAMRSAAQLSSRDLDTLAETIASLASLAQRDLPEYAELFSRRAGASAIASPGSALGTSTDATRAPSVRPPPAARVPTAPLFTAPKMPDPTTLGPATETPAFDPAPRTRTAIAFPAVVEAPQPVPVSATTSATASTEPRVARAPAAPPLALLVVGPDALAAQLRAVLPREAELTSVRTFSDAVTAARDTAPDVIMAACAAPADGLGLLAALRGDPLTDFLPVILLAEARDGVDVERARENGAADLIAWPAHDDALIAAIDRCAKALVPPVIPPPSLREVTLEELTHTLTDEIRRGLLDAAGPRGNRARVPLAGGSEVLAATWAAIARVREIVEKRTQGRVRFELPAAPLGTGGAHVLALSDDVDEDERTNARDAQAGDDPLPGRRALVVDDDPAVVRFFAGLLREAGMEVLECADGATALSEARSSRPDVVLSDILMPGLDGFALCGAIRRDVALRHTPIVLLSWKDDLLLWMREMGAQAQGYLRKEARAEAILARVRSVLRPRVRLLRRLEALSEGRELRGRVERVGVFALLETVARALGNATLTVVDAHSATELSVRAGTVVRAVRTASTPSSERVEGEAALTRVLGVSNARFSVQRDTHAVHRNLHGDLAVLLARGASEITALETAVSAAALLEVASMDLDVDAATAFAQGLPPAMRALVERIATGEGPRTLLLRDRVAPEELEPLLIELVRAGVVRGVRGPAGQDLLTARAVKPSQAPPPPTEASSAGSGSVWSLAQAPHAPHVEEVFAAQEKEEAQPHGAEWTPPSNADEAAKPGFGIDNEADSLASAVLRELREPDDDGALAPTVAAVPSVAEGDGPADSSREEAPAKPESPLRSSAKPSDPPRAPTAREASDTQRSDEAPTARLVSLARPQRDDAEGAPAFEDPTTEGSESKLELDARGLPRRRPVTAPPPPGTAPVPTEVANVQTVATTNESIIIDETALGASVEVHEPRANADEGAEREDTSPVGHRAVSAGPSNTVLMIGVLALGALSFFGVRAYLQNTEPPAPPRPVSAVSAPSSEHRDPPREPRASDVRSVPTASAEPSAAPRANGPSAQRDEEPREAPSANAPSEVAPPSATAHIEDLTPEEQRDLVAGRALLTVRGTADELEYDHRPLGPAPRSVQLGPATAVGLTYRRGATTGFVLVTLEAGRATRVELPPP